MIGSIIDRAASYYIEKRGTKTTWKIHEIKWTSEKVVWLVFLGWYVDRKLALNFNLVPRRGTSLVVELPHELVNSNPHKTKEILLKAIKDVRTTLKGKRNMKLNVIAYSAGNALGYYVANHFPAERFISVVCGARLGAEIFDGIATQKVRKASQSNGFLTSRHYDAVLRDLLPIDNIENLPKETHIYLGFFDAFIPLRHGLSIVKQIRKHNPHLKLTVWPFGHVASAFLFGILNRVKALPDIYKD